MLVHFFQFIPQCQEQIKYSVYFILDTDVLRKTEGFFVQIPTFRSFSHCLYKLILAWMSTRFVTVCLVLLRKLTKHPIVFHIKAMSQS